MSECEDKAQGLLSQVEQLQSRLSEAEQTLDAIRSGEVDAIVVSGPSGDQVYTLTGADRAYRVLFETMNEGAAILGLEGTVYYCNAALSEMLKTPMESLIGCSMLRFVAPGDVPTFQGLLNRASEGPQKMEFAFQSGNGDVKSTQISTAPFSVEDSSTICMIVADITEIKRAQSTLRESEQLLRAIFETSQDAIFVKDTSRTFIRLNPASATFFGRPPHELIGHKREDFVGDTQEMMHIKDVDLRVLAGQAIEEQRTVSIGEAKSVWDVAQAPLYDASGEVVGLCGIARNVTDWRKQILWNSSFKNNTPYRSKAMQATLRLAQMAAEKDFTVLLLGESGSGKDFLAEYLHNHSHRANRPYFSINCAAISSELAESELFGHEKGAFTGAVARKRGLLELAEGGTLLLNEIGDLSLPLQSKLLTFLDTKKFTRVGGEKEITVDIRLIAATNKDLEKEVENGQFRKDLFYRLNVLTIKVPPLRERAEDIPILMRQILTKLGNELQIHDMPAIETATVNALKKYSWPGNVRELRNILERSLILSQGQTLDLGDFGFEKREREIVPEGESQSFTISFPLERSLHETTQDLKRFLIDEALRRAGTSKQGAAKLLGISRYSLRHHMKKLEYEDEELGDL